MTPEPRPRPRRVRRCGALLAGMALVLVACGGSETDFDSLDPATQNLVLFESGWQCEIGRFAVDDAADLEQLRVDRRTEHEITDGAYTAFQTRLAEDAELARIVSDQTQACLDADDPIQL